MGGPVLGGGVIVLVAVLLWMVYLLPTWAERRRYDAAERNAVRLNQALRVLAETSETPEVVRVELTARTALAQQKLAKRALAEREQAALEEARTDLDRAREERVLAQETARVEAKAAKREARQAAAALRRSDRAAAAAARRAGADLRRARARRRVRQVASLGTLAGIAVFATGVWQIAATGSSVLVWGGLALAVVSVMTLRRLATVAATAQRVVPVAVPVAPAADLQDVALGEPVRQWAPRELPRPLTASAGSRAAAVLDAAAAREELRQAALEQMLRDRAEAQRPPSIDTARTARAAASASSERPLAAHDDASIEEHVRRLLERRAVGA